MKHTITGICCTITLTLSACQPNLPITYAPIVDMKKVKMDDYNRDLTECRDYAKQVQNDTAAAGILMAIAGAGLGAAVGHHYGDAGYGASVGGIAGAATGTLRGETDYNHGVKGTIDNCLSGRGYKVIGRP